MPQEQVLLPSPLLAKSGAWGFIAGALSTFLQINGILALPGDLGKWQTAIASFAGFVLNMILGKPSFRPVVAETTPPPDAPPNA